MNARETRSSTWGTEQVMRSERLVSGFHVISSDQLSQYLTADPHLFKPKYFVLIVVK